MKTDARVMGGFSGMQQIPRQPIIAELEKQYEIVEVDASKPIDPTLYTVMLAIQPSSLSPEDMVNFTDAVKGGLPTAIFEDPMPLTFDAPGTGEPKQQGGRWAACSAEVASNPREIFARCGSCWGSIFLVHRR